jgi:ribonuclease HII
VVRIRRHALAIGIGAASAGEIDRLGITVTVRLAMQRALARARQRCEINHVLVDGHPVRDLGFPQTAIIRGDHHCLSIAAASVVAKEVRDHLMRRLALRHPAFGWERNAGYGTRTHQQALREHGPTPHHRRSFGAQRELPW